MIDQFNVQTILAIIFFFAPLVYKFKQGEYNPLSDGAKCTLAAMGLPKLVICLYYLITNPAKAVQMEETTQYLTIAVLIILYITGTEIHKSFQKDTTSPKEKNRSANTE